MLVFILSSILYEYNKVIVLFFDLIDIYVYRYYLVFIIVIFLR